MSDKEGDVIPPESDREKVETIEKVPPRHETSSSDQVTPGSDQLGRTQFGKRLSIVETENKTPSAYRKKSGQSMLFSGQTEAVG